MIGVWKNLEPTKPKIEKHQMILVVSASFDHRRTLLRMFEGLNLDAVICSNLAQAKDVLSHRTTALIFCDENLLDWTYRDLFAKRNSRGMVPPVVVTMKDSGWERYLDAIRRGAFDAIRRPFTSTDVELVLIHAMRAEDQGAAYHGTAGPA